MFDGYMRSLYAAPLDRLGRALARRGATANLVSAFGLAAGLGAAGLIAAGHSQIALFALAASRFADGLDGAVARARGATDLGGYLDIVFDFVFYAAVPLAFAVADAEAHALAAATLIASFYVNGATFLGYAILAAKRGLTSDRRGPKSLYFTTGLAEGSETIAVFAAMCLWPAAFAPLAFGFAALCLVTAVARIALAVRVFGG